MRLYKFVNEESSRVELKAETDIMRVIERDCKPFLKEFDQPLYRGTNKEIETFGKIKARTNRRPKDTPLELHDTLNELFYNKFGWYVRSEGTFVARNKSMSGSYGDKYYFLPIGRYKYVYSNDVYDLYSDVNEWKNAKGQMIMIKNRLRYNETQPAGGPEITSSDYDTMERHINKLYTNKGLNTSIKHVKNEGEVVFKCKEYYMLDVGNYNADLEDFSASIIQELGFDVSTPRNYIHKIVKGDSL